MRSEFGRNFLTLISGTALAQIIPFIVAPILSRLYSPEDFGFYSFFISIVGIIAVLATLKYEVAIILPKNNKIAEQLIQTSLILCCIVSVFTMFLVILGYLFFNLNPIYFLLPFAVFLLSVITVFDRYFNRIKSYDKMSYQRIVKSGTESAYNLGGYFTILKSFNLILGFVVGFFFSFFYILISEYKIVKNICLNISLRKFYWSLLKYRNFPKYTLPHTFLNTFSANIPILLIPYFYDATATGHFTFGLKYIQAPLALISAAIFNVMGQEFAENKENKIFIRLKFNAMLKKLALIALTILPLLFFAEPFFKFVFGDLWAEAGVYIQLLSIWILISFIVSTFANIPIIFNEQRKALILEFIYSMAKILPFIVGAGVYNLAIKDVLIIYTILSSAVLIYGLHWYWGLLKK